MTDNVDSPIHYAIAPGVEALDVIRHALTPEEFDGYCKGNMLKYLIRHKNKNGDEDMRKAGKYWEFYSE